MKKFALLAIVCAAALMLAAPNASATALSAGDAYYLGSIDPGAPASATDEVAYINHLITLSPGGTDTVVQISPPKDWLYTRSSNVFAALPSVTTASGIQGSTTPITGIDVNGFTYLLAKYGNVSHVWYVVGLTTVDLESSIGTAGGLSHYSRYGYDEFQRVPDGGMTLMLLGGALVGLEGLRRRFRV